MLRWTFLLVILLFLFTGCGDLEPEMQDTRTVILNMDFHGKSSSRTSSFSPADLSNYKTHLIMVMTSGGNLSNSSYWNYNSDLGEYVLYDSDRKITLNMKINTEFKIFAFLFKKNYSHYDENYLFSANRVAGYYGESQIITIDDRQSRIPANIILNQVSGTDPAGGDFGGDPGDLGDLGDLGDIGGGDFDDILDDLDDTLGGGDFDDILDDLDDTLGDIDDTLGDIETRRRVIIEIKYD